MMNETVPTEGRYDMYTKICVWKKTEYVQAIGFPSWPYYASHILCFIFNIIQTCLIIVLNYLAIHSFYKSSQLRRKTTLFIVMLLSANDLVIGFVGEPLFLLSLTMQITGSENCTMLFVYVLCTTFLMSVSMTTFFVLNFEIYLSIIHPIFHKVKITNRRVLHVLWIHWILLMVVSYLFAFHVNQSAVNVLVTLILSFIILSLVYFHGRIFITVFKRKINQGESSSGVGRGRDFLRRVKNAKSCLLVLLFTACCYAPAGIATGISSTTNLKEIVLAPWSGTFMLSASVLNSIVFYWRNTVLRKETTKVLRTFCGLPVQNG